jgi:hypothetical protein
VPPSVQNLLRIARQVILAAVVLLATVYLCDYLSLRMKIPASRTGSVQIQRSWAVTMKDKKTEFMFDPPQAEECVNSLFPHSGDPPCWYAERHRKPRVVVGP